MHTKIPPDDVNRLLRWQPVFLYGLACHENQVLLNRHISIEPVPSVNDSVSAHRKGIVGIRARPRCGN